MAIPLRNDGKPFNRLGSTLGVMDDLQIAIHSYDGCGRGCPGCVVDKYFKNNGRGKLIIGRDDLRLIHSRVTEYYEWCRGNLNTKSSGYFGSHDGGYQIQHFSYTFRFGNHSELPEEALDILCSEMQSQYRVFSTAPGEDIKIFTRIRDRHPGRYFLEIIYDPVADGADDLARMITDMRSQGILGYPEVLITRRLLDAFSPEKFVEEAIGDRLGEIGTQMQFGRYTPSRTRGFRTSQMVPLDEEVEWLTRVAELIISRGYRIDPIPIGEYAVTFLDEYKEHKAFIPGFGVDISALPEEEEFNIENVIRKTRDIFISSLYIDHNLDVHVWSESMGQHVLDRNFGYEPIGNLRSESIIAMVTRSGGVLDAMLSEVIRNLVTHPKCAPCRYKSFCASHAVPLFRKWEDDNGKHCYGYLPVIREFQKDPRFLQSMIDSFKDLDF